VHIYDATLWVVGDRWIPDEPHAIDLESGRDVPANTLVGAAIDEMRKLKMGDDAQLKLWSEEMKRLLPPRPSRRSGGPVLFIGPHGHSLLQWAGTGRNQRSVIQLGAFQGLARPAREEPAATEVIAQRMNTAMC
jgi:hypothetical protein